MMCLFLIIILYSYIVVTIHLYTGVRYTKLKCFKKKFILTLKEEIVYWIPIIIIYCYNNDALNTVKYQQYNMATKCQMLYKILFNLLMFYHLSTESSIYFDLKTQ